MEMMIFYKDWLPKMNDKPECRVKEAANEQIHLQNKLQDKCIVEGETDVEIYKIILPKHFSIIAVEKHKGKVDNSRKAIRDELEKNGAKLNEKSLFIGIIDADYDRLLGKDMTKKSEYLFYTDKHDMETTILSLFIKDGQFELDGNKVSQSVFDATLKIGYLRYGSIGPNNRYYLYFKNFKKDFLKNYIGKNGNEVTLKLENLIKTAKDEWMTNERLQTNKNQNHSSNRHKWWLHKTKRIVKDLVKQIKKKNDPWFVYNGHDITFLLSYYLDKNVISIIKKQINSINYKDLNMYKEIIDLVNKKGAANGKTT